MAEKFDPMDEASAYLVLEKDRYGFDIREMRKGKPAMKAGQVAVKVIVKMRRSVFEEVIPTITAEVSRADLIEPVVEVVPAPEIPEMPGE